MNFPPTDYESAALTAELPLVVVYPLGFEPSAFGVEARRSNPDELRVLIREGATVTLRVSKDHEPKPFIESSYEYSIHNLYTLCKWCGHDELHAGELVGSQP